jgi:hypothetical protein
MKKFKTSKTLLLITTLIFLLNSCTVEVRIDGCTDPCAANFDPLADDDDGSCLYSAGCMDPAAFNYDACALIESPNICEYTCDVVYYLDQSAAIYMDLAGISYYSFYDYLGTNLGFITSNYYWPTTPPNCSVPLLSGSTLVASLYWSGNYGSNTGTFSWSAYPDDGPIADYSGSFYVTPNECARVELSFKKIEDYKASK